MLPLSEFLSEAVDGQGSTAACVIPSPGAEPDTVWTSDAEEEPAFLLYSITKTFLSTVALRLVDKKALSLDDPLTKWDQDFDRADHVTVRQLLNHTAGIPNYGNFPHYHEGVRRSPQAAWSPERFADETYRKGLSFAPGEGWEYSSPGYMLLLAVLKRSADKPWGELIQEQICAPLGLRRTSQAKTMGDLSKLTPAPSTLLSTDGSVLDTREHYDPGWVSHGVLSSTATEVAMFYDALLGGQLISPESLAAMKELVPLPPHVAEHVPCDAGYGLGLMGGTPQGIGEHWGHGGGGPGYVAGAFHRHDTGRTACFLAAIEKSVDAQSLAMDLLRD